MPPTWSLSNQFLTKSSTHIRVAANSEISVEKTALGAVFFIIGKELFYRCGLELEKAKWIQRVNKMVHLEK